MKTRILGCLLMTVAFLGLSSVAAEARQRGELPQAGKDIFLKVECPSKAYVGEVLNYELWLYTPVDVRIADIGVEHEGSWGTMDKFRFNNSGTKQSHVERVKGKDFLARHVATFYFCPSQTGSQKITGGLYTVAVAHEVIVNDFFWGPMRQYENEYINVVAPDVKVKVKGLPRGNMPADFSGGVGDYKVSSRFVSRRVAPGSRARALITVSGYGLLNKVDMDVMKRLNSQDLKLIYASSDVRRSVVNGRVWSELVMELNFEPLVEHGLVPEFDFSFFNPATGKYETASSRPLEWGAEGKTTKQTEIAPSMEI